MEKFKGYIVYSKDTETNENWYLLNSCDTWTCNLEPLKTMRTLEKAKKIIEKKYNSASILTIKMEQE